MTHLPALFLQFLGCPEYLLHGPGDHSMHVRVRMVPFHSKGFAWSCLSVGKDTDIVTVQCWLDQLGNFSKHLLLAATWLENFVKGKVVTCGCFVSSSNALKKKEERRGRLRSHYLVGESTNTRVLEWGRGGEGGRGREREREEGWRERERKGERKGEGEGEGEGGREGGRERERERERESREGERGREGERERE